MNTQTEFEEMVEEVVEDTLETSKDKKIPSEQDPEWSEYLLDQLSDTELINGAPTVDGLRRINTKMFWRNSRISYSNYRDTNISKQSKMCG